MNRYIAMSSLTAVGLSLAAAAAEVDLQSLVAEAVLKTASEFLPDRADFRWGATHGREGAPPAGATASVMYAFPSR